MKVARVLPGPVLAVDENPIPEVGPRDILVKTRVSGLCSGELMGWYIHRKAPLVLGHEMVGDVVEVGEELSEFKPGDRVVTHHHVPCFECEFCRRGDYVQCPTWRRTRILPGGMAEYFLIPAANVPETRLIPDHVTYEQAAFTEPLGCVVKCLRRANIQRDDTVLVLGMGIMGLLHLTPACSKAREVFAADFRPERLAKAMEVAPVETINLSEQPLPERLANVVIVGPGSIAAMESAFRAVKPGGTIVWFAPTPPEEQLVVNPHDLYFQDITITSSYSCGPNDTRQALELIAQGFVNSDKLISDRFPIEEIGRAYKAMSSMEIIKAVVVFD